MVNFNMLIDNYLKREHRPKTPGRYYPSEIGGCLRKVWYSYKHPVETKPNLMKIFHMGNMLHDFVVDVLKSERNPHIELVQSEFPFKMNIDDFIISGRIDDIILVREDEEIVVVEVKSTKFVDSAREPLISHRIQLQLYMHAMQNTDYKVKRGLILYIEKNTLKCKTFEVVYDPGAAQLIEQRFKELHKNIKENKLPEPEAKQKSEIKWMCNYCDYKEMCDKNEISKCEQNKQE